jgi:hypothetical protein
MNEQDRDKNRVFIFSRRRHSLSFVPPAKFLSRIDNRYEASKSDTCDFAEMATSDKTKKSILLLLM